MNIINNQTYDEERALYGLSGITVENCRFEGPADGESALKETNDITVRNCFFALRYPFWHVTDACIDNITMTDTCRAALWYDKNITITNSNLGGIKALRECDDITLASCAIVSKEFGWRCRGVQIKNSSLESEYPFFENRDMKISGLTMKGKYSFQYVENAEISDSHLDTKDAFWHSKNVTVRDSEIKGEYLGWYSEGLTLINCHISGTQPLCYCKDLTLIDCTMEGCDLSFENSTVKATVKGHIDSVKNPLQGSIEADTIGEIILDTEKAKAAHCQIKTK